MYNNSLNTFFTAASALGGPSKKAIKNWILDINDRGSLNPEDIVFRDAMVYLVGQYRNIVREIVSDTGEKMSDYYRQFEEKNLKKSRIQNVKDYIEREKQNRVVEKIELTNYQEASVNFLKENRDKNVAVLLPTGYGKTIVSFHEMLHYIENGKKVVFSAPTNELIHQQYEDFILFLQSEKKQDLIKNLEHSKADKELHENTSVVFCTHHRAEKLIKEKFLSENDLIIVDEIHIGEGKKGEKKEHLYPIYKSSHLLKEERIRIIGLTATTTNKEVLEEKIGIEKFFYAGKKEYFIPKNRHIIGLEQDEDYNSIIAFIEENIIRSSAVLRRFLIKNQFPKNQISIFFEKEILSNNFLDTKNDPVIEELIEKIESIEIYGEKFYKKLVYKIAKYIQIRKMLISKNYVGLGTTIKKYCDEADNIFWGYKKDLSGFYHAMLRILREKVRYKRQHPKEEKMWEIICKNKEKNNPTLVYINDVNSLVGMLWKAQKMGIKAGFMKSAGNNSGKLINTYSIEGIKKSELDVVFITDVVKQGINFDVNEFIFYSAPANAKDLLQFEGRVGRYSRDNNIYYLFIKNTFELPNHKIREADNILANMFKEAEEIENSYGVTSVYSKKGNNFDKMKPETELGADNINVGVKNNSDSIKESEIIHSRFMLSAPQIKYTKTGNKPYILLKASDSYGSFDLSIFGFIIEEQASEFIDNNNLDGSNIFDIKGIFKGEGKVFIYNDSPHSGLTRLKTGEFDVNDYVGRKYRYIPVFDGVVEVDDTKIDIESEKVRGQVDIFSGRVENVEKIKKRNNRGKKKDVKQVQQEMDI